MLYDSLWMELDTQGIEFGGANGCNATMEKSRPKWENVLFLQNIQHSAPVPKLIREIPLFYNSIFSKSSFNVKLNLYKIEYEVIKKKKKNCMELKFNKNATIGLHETQLYVKHKK